MEFKTKEDRMSKYSVWLERLARIFVLSAVALLALAGVLIAIGHSPDAITYNYQAEVLANFAYVTFILGLLLQVIHSIFFRTEGQ